MYQGRLGPLRGTRRRRLLGVVVRRDEEGGGGRAWASGLGSAVSGGYLVLYGGFVVASKFFVCENKPAVRTGFFHHVGIAFVLADIVKDLC